MKELILLTAFDPFGGSDRNFSAELVERVASAWSEPGLELATARLPTLYDGAVPAALSALGRLPRRPLFVIAFGEADRPQLNLETAAWNRDHAAKADNAGVVRAEQTIEAGGPERRGFAFPVQAVAEGAVLSISPGSFVCNHTAFVLAGKLEVPFTFIHVPATKLTPDLEAHARVVTRLIKTAAEFQRRPVPAEYPLPHASNSRRLPATLAEVEALLQSPCLEPKDAEFLRQLKRLYDKP